MRGQKTELLKVNSGGTYSSHRDFKTWRLSVSWKH